MVDFLHNSTGEDVQEDKKNQSLLDFNQENDPLSPSGLLSVPDFDEFPLAFADSLLDFDSLRDFILDSPMAELVTDGISVVNEVDGSLKLDSLICLNQEQGQIGFFQKSDVENEGSLKLDSLSCLNQEQGKHGFFEKSDVENEGSLKLDSLSCLNREIENGVCDNGLIELPEGNDLGCIVEKEMGRVSISGTENERQAGNVAAAAISKNEESDKVDISNKAEEIIVNDGKLKGNKDVSNSDTESESEDESESSSSSSASSSDSDEEEEEDESSSDEEAEGDVDMEEGEIVVSDPDEMVEWDDGDDDSGGAKGPIRSKNELQVLPPVPEVTATLQPHHKMQPVGVVSSIIGAQVVIEGVEKHTPLNDGSILWITESRSPLGIVDEIFGPVRNPYYIVRYNSDHEVPLGIHPGTLISFVPEFSSRILNDNSLYKKGYDASGENDEEMSEDEFSDDEKEAEYKRMQKMKKRGITNDQKPGNNKKDKRKSKNRSQNWKHDQGAATHMQSENGKSPSDDQSQRFIPTAAASLDQGIHQSASLQGHGQSIRPPSVPPFPQMQNSPGLAAPSNGVWTNGIPFQQPQNMGFPNMMPNIGMPFPQQGHPQQIFQMPFFEQQINPNVPSSFMFPGGLPNFGAGPSFAPWPAFGQNVFNQSPMSMGLPGQFTPAPVNLGGQIPANGPQSGQNNNSQPNVMVPGNINGSPNFNQGQSPLPMSLPGQFTPTPMNLGGQVPENGPKSGQNNNSQPRGVVPGYNNGSPNFNRGAHSAHRGNHRGGGRFGGRRGRSQRN
ncbi:H/ACA ribonucleoprotein complex non-core subunit NAF1 [Capsicum galapagoense]